MRKIKLIPCLLRQAAQERGCGNGGERDNEIALVEMPPRPKSKAFRVSITVAQLGRLAILIAISRSAAVRNAVLVDYVLEHSRLIARCLFVL